MRVFKFRAWNEKHKWYDDSLWVDSSDGRLWDACSKVYDTPNQEIERVKGEYVLEQFTGLKDKTGKEIYEGDILLNEHVGGGEPYSVEMTPKWWHHEVEYGLIEGSTHTFAVVGNIHQNPSLLSLKQREI